MPISDCNVCGSPIQWNWEEDFYKFGFGDGDGQIETKSVADALYEAGYGVGVRIWEMHNHVITSITENDVEQIAATVRLGYDDPRGYLPSVIITLLDEKFPSDVPYYF